MLSILEVGGGMTMTSSPYYYEHIMGKPPRKDEFEFYIGIHSFPKTDLHFHPFAELTFVLDGCGYEKINGIMHRMEPGTISLVLPNHMHEFKSDTDQTIRKYCCMFDINLLFGSSYDSDWYRWLYRIGSQMPSYAAFQEETAARVEGIFAQLMAEYVKPELTGHHNMIRNKLSEVLILLLREINKGPGSNSDWNRKDRSQPFWPALHYVHVHFADKLSLESVATRFLTNSTYLSRLFRENTGLSFLEYLHRLRINSAATMLIHTDKSVADITFETGFESIRTFSRVFRDMKGKSPREFRKAHP
ncbi:helix-turn-helix domain-containing protein [Paenibacillus mesophilus]|nr:helix-turn-helix domain-containing protein [Paenibacillus mesophilus]